MAHNQNVKQKYALPHSQKKEEVNDTKLQGLMVTNDSKTSSNTIPKVQQKRRK